MPEETNQPQGNRGRSRRERVEIARSRDILDVANELNMELVRDGKDYRWKEHDSLVISPDKNKWNWFSRHQGGDVIALVETIREINFNQAIDYLNDGTFKEFTAVEREKEPFRYHLQPYEQDFVEARNYLKVNRGLSDETIDFFLEKGVLAQANAMLNNSVEPVVVFKTLTSSGEITGATLQGIEENRDKWPGRGYAKNIIRNSDGMDGLHVDIGKPNRLIFTESSIDLMSYYEINKDTLQDVRLVSMDGLKEATIGRHLAQLQSELSGRPLNWTPEQLAKGLQTAIDSQYFADGKHSDMITLAVDNDTAGRTFIEELKDKGAAVTVDLPELRSGQDKADWNDTLQYRYGEEADHDYHTEVSYDTFKSSLKNLTQAVQSQIQAGVLSVTLSDEAYFYTLVNYTGWSHPMQQLKPEALEKLKEHRLFFESINDTNIERFKEKGTPEQNQMYELLKGNQRELGRSNTSTVFSEEVAISAYNLNRRLNSLTAENWGQSYSDPLGNLGQDTWKILSYPANEIETYNNDYDFQLVSYHLMEYLNGKTGTVEISQETYETILQQLREDAVIIMPEVSEEATTSIEKSPEHHQETDRLSEHQKNERTNGSQGSLQPKAEGSPTPAPEVGTFERSVTSRPTLSSHLLYFTINEEFQSSNDGRYHAVTPSDLAKLNRTIRRQTIQNAAQYYLDELANSKIYYVTPDKTVQVHFEEQHFMHLTGIKPIAEGQTPEKTLHDFAEGNGHFDNIFLANNDAAFDKLNVLSDLSVATESTSFYFDDLTDIRRYNGRFDSLIKSDDKDIILLFKELEDENFIPISVFQSRTKLTRELEAVDKTPILGVYRERDGQLEQLSINENFVSDGGEEMLDSLKNQLTSPDSLGQDNNPSPSPAEENQVYKNYHIRLERSEEWPNSPRLPFEEQSIVSYEDFVKELYKVNQEFYQTHHESIEQTIAGNSAAYLPFTKIKFDIYAPGGQLIKEGVRYDIGDETEPVSRLLGLGYRRLEGQAELAAIDENVLSQLENQALNQEISQEADNPQNSLTAPETDLIVSSAEERDFRSPMQETKGQLEQRVNEIVADNQKAAEEAAPAKEPPGKIDYSQVTPHELSEIAFQKIREFTRSPEALAEYMDFMSKFPQLSPRNVALIQDQWKGANAVATYNQWQALGKRLELRPEDVIETRNTYTNQLTGETKEVVHQGLSVKSGEKAQITLFRPLMARMIPVLDDQGNQVKNSKGNPKFKKISEATPQEKALLKERKLRVVQFQERDQETGLPKFTTYKVFELSQTTLKPESYPKAMPNRQYQFDTDQVKTKEVLDGLCDYAGTLGVHLLRDEVHELGNAKGAFYPGQQKILLNPNNLPGEQIATTIHELAHATLHNPKFTAYYKEDVSTPRKELEAEMTSHLVSKHFGLDTSEAAIDYMAGWTKNLTQLDDKQLAESMKRIHQTVSKMVKHIEHHTKPYEPPKNRGQSPNFPKSPTKGLKP
ncbi:PBECR4 domain-containing protein [Streptococcus sp. DTU_2020_1000888_1_SI_GRL_NUU_041A]|uniref:PBECR4 domain-containing protein n=1 Tax=Streptococcus sp. DTU_2020_1000888_1_SI_GRL_NUU_041A TaxID=3077723 RepID=UPI0028E8DE0C|nr:PBECR4 domain-containing protein [Streptococcus sp. DTU_2020_1000888_1_SI_GRL_NUU_041A]WNU93920.1 PBECR4 domain-containing protein [Streptococcus sp. DTU_2020_1000888_1_SI_GRL_NUU_041A]